MQTANLQVMRDPVSCFPASRGLWRRGKNEGKERDSLSPLRGRKWEIWGRKREELRMRKREMRGRRETLLPLIFALSRETSAYLGRFLLTASPNPLQLHDNRSLINKDLTFYTLPWLTKREGLLLGLNIQAYRPHNNTAFAMGGQYYCFSVNCSHWSVLSFTPRFPQYLPLPVMQVDSTYECKTQQNATFT